MAHGTSALTDTQLERYRRHLPVIGMEGQQQLLQGKVLCIGAGGLGCPVLQYLTAAGVGHIGIVDHDQIERSNLQRQVLYTEADIGKLKAKVAAERCQAQNPDIQFSVITERLTEANAKSMLAGYDVIVDATDNFTTRYIINMVSRATQIPLVSASILQFTAQLSVFNFQNGPCYQCLYPDSPTPDQVPDCATGGVLGVLPGVVGSLQATEVIKILTSQPGVLSGTVMCLDLLSMQFTQYQLPKQPGCCPTHCAPPTEPTRQTLQTPTPEIDVVTLADLLAEDTALQLIDVREAYEREICHIGGTWIPMQTIPESLHQFNHSAKTIIYCRSGVRSAAVTDFMAEQGFTDVFNLKGGILAWIDHVDPSLKRY